MEKNLGTSKDFFSYFPQKCNCWDKLRDVVDAENGSILVSCPSHLYSDAEKRMILRIWDERCIILNQVLLQL